MDRQTKRVQVEFEVDSRGGITVSKCSHIVRDAVLVGVKRGRTRCDIGCRYDMKEVLICDKGLDDSTNATRLCMEHLRSCVTSNE